MTARNNIVATLFRVFGQKLPPGLKAKIWFVEKTGADASSRKLPPQTLDKSQSFQYGIRGDGRPRILITGGLGHIGFRLATILREKFGSHNVILSDVRKPPSHVLHSGPYVYLDILDKTSLEKTCVNLNTDWLVHLAYMPSAVSETDLPLTLRVNVEGLHNMLDAATHFKLRLFVPSSLATLSPDHPQKGTSDAVAKRPKAINDVTKTYAEHLGEYYHLKHGLDFRCLRYAGVIFPYQEGNHITNYVPAMLQDALASKLHLCYLRPDTRLPMVYITDLLTATVDYLMVPECKLSTRTYNMGALNFTPEEFAGAVRNFFPDFQVQYNVSTLDDRQALADAWIRHVNYNQAVRDWAYRPVYTDLHVPALCQRILQEIRDAETVKAQTADGVRTLQP